MMSVPKRSTKMRCFHLLILGLCLTQLFCPFLLAHQTLAIPVEEHSVRVTIGKNTPITFFYEPVSYVPRKDRLSKIVIGDEKENLVIDGSEMADLSQVQYTDIKMFSDTDSNGRYNYFVIKFGMYDPHFYGDNKGGYKYLRLYVRNRKYTHRVIVNGYKKSKDGSSKIEYLLKKVGEREVSNLNK